MLQRGTLMTRYQEEEDKNEENSISLSFAQSNFILPELFF